MPLPEFKDVVTIGGHLYVRTAGALDIVLRTLREIGYQVEDLGSEEYQAKWSSMRPRTSRETMQREGWSMWYASLNVTRGKCGSCGGLIDIAGIRVHKHRCELCGAFTFLRFVDGTTVRFSFYDGDGRCSMRELSMRVRAYDDVKKRLILYEEPVPSRSWGVLPVDKAREELTRHRQQWTPVRSSHRVRLAKGLRKHIRRLKAAGRVAEACAIAGAHRLSPRARVLRCIAIPYDARSIYVSDRDVISLSEVQGEQYNHSMVKVWEGREYPEYFGDFPMPESLSIYEMWHWAPLEPSPMLHEKILHAGGLVSRCDYYYQDGRRAVYDGNYRSMRLFVEHCTTLDVAAWDAMIKRTDGSGPGTIRAIAAFCHPNAVARNEPNIGNVLVGVSKLMGGQRLTDDEAGALCDGLKDDAVRADFFSTMRRVGG